MDYFELKKWLVDQLKADQLTSNRVKEYANEHVGRFLESKGRSNLLYNKFDLLFELLEGIDQIPD